MGRARSVGEQLTVVASVIIAVTGVASAEEASNEPRDQLTEIVVTAEKRAEPLQQVPSSITAITGTTLEAEGVQTLSDLASYVPGLVIQDGGTPGQRTIAIRGLSEGYFPAANAPLVSTYIDDSQLGASDGTARSSQLGLDLMPYDIDHIEVLKGPQGFIYGAGAMGGIIKYVLRQPDTEHYELRVGADSSYTENAGGANWNSRAAVNIPLIAGTLGMRASAFFQKNAGYIDNVGAGVNQSNYSTESGGRFSMLWNASSDLTVQASFLIQNVNSADRTGVTVDATTLQPIYSDHSWFSNFTEPFKQQTLFGNVTLNWDAGFAKLTSVSTWSKMDSNQLRTDLTPLLIPYLTSPGLLAASTVYDPSTSYTEEIRLTSPDNQRLTWLVGGIWNYSQSPEVYSLPEYSPTRVPLPPSDNLAFSGSPGSQNFREYAAFGDATLRITNRVDVSGGLRYARNESENCQIVGGLLNGPTAFSCNFRPYQGKVTWMANARYHIAEDDMLYARVATGYRPGGGCNICGPLGTPLYYVSDSITNYELGAKGEYLDHRLRLDLSVFYIPWKNIQETIIEFGGAYPGNGGSAVSSGFEVASTYQVSRDLQLDASLAYTHAYLTSDAPGIGGLNGNELPQSARWSGTLSANYSHPLRAGLALLLSASYRYKDSVLNQFEGTGEPLPMPPQNIFNLSIGVSTEHLTTRIYARNLFDDRAYTGLLLLTTSSASLVPIQPRTIGLAVDYHL